MQQSAEEQAYKDARRILRSLLLGVDPEVHTRISPECVVMQPEVKVALALGVEALQLTQWVRRNKVKVGEERPKVETYSQPRSSLSRGTQAALKKGPGRAGEGWSNQEDNQVTRAFYQGKRVYEIARNQQRTRGAIAARLVRLGLVSNKAEAGRMG